MHRGAILLLVLAVVAVTGMPAQAVQPGVQGVYRDVFWVPPFESFTFVGGCGVDGLSPSDGAFDVDARNRTFEFRENPGVGSSQPFQGQLQTSCGEASVNVQVPRGASHIHVRFQADRRIQDASGGVQEPNMVQEVRASVGGVPFYRTAYIPANATSLSPLPYDLPPIVPPSGVTAFTLSWYFSDDGADMPRGIYSAASLHGVRARVEAPAVEFSGIPEPFATTTDASFQGRFRIDEADVEFNPSPFELSQGPAHVRVRFDPRLEVQAFVLPDGTRLTHFDTQGRTTHLPHDYDGPPVLENGNTAWSQAVLPAAAVAAAGEGTYRLELRSVEAIDPVPSLVILNGGLLLLPLLFAALAYRGIHVFKRESFGGFARSAAALQVALWLVFVFYVAVVITAWVDDDVARLAVEPLALPSLLLYGEVALAILAFLALFTVGERLRRITRPAPA